MVPYEEATASPASSRAEITKLLQRFGCESVGFMDDFQSQSVILAFKHRGRPVQLIASAKGWASLWLKQYPYSSKRRGSLSDYQQRAMKQGMIAVNSILRDWIKGQVTAVECGLMSFEAVFMPYMLTSDGRTVVEHVIERKMLPPPRE